MSDKSIPLRPNAKDSPIVHRQASIRYAPNTRANCKMLALRTGKLGPVKILDISVSGISLLTERAYPPGTLIAVEIANNDGDYSRTQLIKVVHVKELGHKNFVLGGAFTNPLNGDDIQALLS